MSIGDEDISGDFNEYPSVIELNVNKNTVLLKGDADKNHSNIPVLQMNYSLN